MSKEAAWNWRLGAAEVRDARHVHNGPEVVGGPAKRKDTKRWCKGKVGREHVLQVRDATELGKHRFSQSLVRFCTKCGKEVDTYWVPRQIQLSNGRQCWLRKPTPVPDWVREHLASKAA